MQYLSPVEIGVLKWLVNHDGKTSEPVHLYLKQIHNETYPRSVTYMPKTKRPRKVHFVWADTNDVKCEVRQNGNTLYSKWAPDVTCVICRQMMVNRGITRIL